MESQINSENPAPASSPKYGLIVGVILLFVVGGVLGYFVGKGDSDPVVGQTATPSASTSASIDPMPGWTTYSNVQYGFEFQYPMGESLSTQDRKQDPNIPFEYLVRIETGGHSFFTVRIGGHDDDVCRETPRSTGKITINGIQMIKITCPEINGFVTEVYNPEGRNNFRISLSYRDDGNVGAQEMVEQILSTFRFTN